MKNNNKILKTEINHSKHLMGIKESKIISESKTNAIDTISMNVPLFIRMLEYAKEDAKTDMDLHSATERILELLKNKDCLSMDSYIHIVGGKKNIKEGLSLRNSYIQKHNNITIGIPQYVIDFCQNNSINDPEGLYEAYVKDKLGFELGYDMNDFESWVEEDDNYTDFQNFEEFQ